MTFLKLALLHMDVGYRQVSCNRDLLEAFIDQSARQGAQFIVAPEMAVPGYSFNSRAGIAPFVETIDGPTLSMVRKLARCHRVYVCIGLALEEVRSRIFTNSVVAVSPDGDVVCQYHKINAESSWACPGDPRRDNTFDTPWGRVGLLICSDTYPGLLPRVTALRGADLLLVPAAWPPDGLNPAELWQARAMDNGFYVAACNRTGMDRRMDCRMAPSSVCDPWGNMLLEGVSEHSDIFYVDLRLSAEGRLDDGQRRKCLADRRPQHYHDCYLSLRSIGDLTAYLRLPKPGSVDLHCPVPQPGTHPADQLVRLLAAGEKKDTLYLLPVFTPSDTALDTLRQSALKHRVAVVACTANGDGRRYYLFNGREEVRQWDLPSRPFGHHADFPRVDLGAARIVLTSLAALKHPEFAVAASKQGCDLALMSEKELSDQDRLMAGVRTVENLAVAACAGAGAGIWLPPEGRQRWEEAAAGPGEVCRNTLDTHQTRLKRFHDSVDFGVLLRDDKSPASQGAPAG